MHMCTMRVISPPPLSGQACCAPSLVLYSEDAVTGTVCVTPPPHIRFVGAGQKSVEKRFKMYEIVDPGHGRTQNFFSGGGCSCRQPRLRPALEFICFIILRFKTPLNYVLLCTFPTQVMGQLSTLPDPNTLLQNCKPIKQLCKKKVVRHSYMQIHKRKLYSSRFLADFFFKSVADHTCVAYLQCTSRKNLRFR